MNDAFHDVKVFIQDGEKNENIYIHQSHIELAFSCTRVDNASHTVVQQKPESHKRTNTKQHKVGKPHTIGALDMHYRGIPHTHTHLPRDIYGSIACRLVST